jgi:hypothetical protein
MCALSGGAHATTGIHHTSWRCRLAGRRTRAAGGGVPVIGLLSIRTAEFDEACVLVPRDSRFYSKTDVERIPILLRAIGVARQ